MSDTFTPAQRAFLRNAQQIAPIAADRTAPLYRFLRYANQVERQGVHDFLVNRHVRFGRPRDFNDPFDCRPHLKLPGQSPAWQRRWFERETLRLVREDFPGDTAREQLARQQLANVDPQQHVADAERNVRNNLLDKQQMLCLCGNQDHVLMWAYYADRHHGVAIHLRPDVWPIAAGMQVSYTDRYPAMLLSQIKDGRELVRQFALKKAKAWRHEDEYRVLVQDEDPLRLAATWLSPSTVVLPPGAIAGVTVGSLMEEANVQLVIASASSATLAIPVYRAVPQRKKFKLDFVQIA
jgi:hypothetical protein